MNTQILQIATLVMLVSLTMAMSQQATQVRQMPQRFEKEIHKTVSAEYLLYLPKEYGVSKQRKWPPLLFLHGSGERGSDLELVKRHGPPTLIEQVKAGGSDVRFTVYPDAGHDAWTAAYNNPELYRWFLVTTQRDFSITVQNASS